MLKRRWVRFGLLAFGLLLAVVVSRAALMTAPAVDRGESLPLPEFDEAAAVARLSSALQLATISLAPERTGEAQGDERTFHALHALLEREFPRVHKTLRRETVNQLSLVYRWPGSDPALAPILLLAHMDVVPVEPGTEADWGQAPFSGAVVDGEIWGRGAMDDKTSVMAILEAIEALLANGFVPQRTVVLAFGHDEETGGRRGAQAMAKRFEAEGLAFEMVLDEGGAVVEGSLPGIDAPIAFVGIAEKGYASLELTAAEEGGHSSMPSTGGAIARMGAAVRRLDEHQMAPRIGGPTQTMLETIGPQMPFAMRLGVANLWLLERVLLKVMMAKPAAAATVRTTTALTVFEAGSADNVLPQSARAIVNFRILPGDTVESVLTHARAVIGDASIEVKCLDACWDPSAPSPTDTRGFARLQQAILHTFDRVVVAPYLVVGATDAHHYQHLSPATYRFLPITMKDGQRKRLHGTGERISVADYHRAIRFYLDLIMRTTTRP